MTDAVEWRARLDEVEAARTNDANSAAFELSECVRQREALRQMASAAAKDANRLASSIRSYLTTNEAHHEAMVAFKKTPTPDNEQAFLKARRARYAAVLNMDAALQTHEGRTDIVWPA